MFRNKLLVRVEPPASLSSSPFLLVQLSLTAPSSPPSPSRSIELETLCCKLSRRWRLACFHQSSEIFIIYQRAQSDSAARVREELIGTLAICNVGVEEEVNTTSLIAKAVECGLRSVMLDHDWRCIGDNSFVYSTFASSEERNHLLALNVSIQLEAEDTLVFLVSPDILWFKRHKILDLVSCKMLQRFDDGEEIILEAYSFSTACTVLPYLYEGHVIGLSKLLPAGENFERLEELWSFKYGLALPSYYFIDVQLTSGGHVNRQWFPSSFVLQGSGLVPAPQTIRALKAVHALESFTKIARAWDFFDQGLLKVKDISSLGIGTSILLWKTATSNLLDCKARTNNIPDSDTNETIRENNFISEELLLTLDFRTPKPRFGAVPGNRIFEHTEIQENAIPSKISLDITSKCITNADIISSTNEFRPLILELAPITQSTSSESGRVNDSTVVEENHTSAEAFLWKEGTSIQTNGGRFQSSSKASRKKEKDEYFLDKNSSPDPGKVPPVETLGKRTLNNEMKVHSKDDTVEPCTKMRAKQSVDRSDITTKVIDYHTRGELQSLTVADLKCFLSTRKAKVGGKKEELVQRITALLS